MSFITGSFLYHNRGELDYSHDFTNFVSLLRCSGGYSAYAVPILL